MTTSTVFSAISAKDGAGLQAALAAGADPDELSTRGMSALRYAVQRGHKPSVSCLLSYGATADSVDDRTALMEAAASKNVWFVKALLGAGANPNHDHDETTALHHAVRNRKVDNVRALLAGGANPNVGKHDLGHLTYTPLMLAALDGFCDVAAILLDAGADPDTAQGRRNQNPLSFAIRRVNRRMIQLLLAAGASTGDDCLEPQCQERLALIHPLSAGVFCDLDAALADPAAVVHLDLYGHGLKTLPDVVFPRVRTARIGANRFSRVPEVVYRWTTLETLGMLGVRTKFFDAAELARLPALKRIIVRWGAPDAKLKKLARALPSVDIAGWDELSDFL